MKSFALLLASLAVAGSPGRAASQKPTAEHFFRPGSVALSIYGGGGAFSKVHRIQGAEGSEDPADVVVQTSGAFAGEAVWWLTGNLGLRLHGSFLPSRFDVRSERDESGLAGAGTAARVAWRGVHVWIADAAVLVRPPVTLGRMMPYAVVGGGIVSYRPRGEDALPPELGEAFSGGARNAGAAVLGLGAVLPLQRERLLLSFALTNHITRPLVAAGADPSTTSHVRLLAGITLPLRSGR